MTIKEIKQRIVLQKKEIVDWVKKNGKMPNQNSTDVVERRSRTRMNAYINNPKESTFDPKFRKVMLSLGLKSRKRVATQKEEHKRQILRWADKHGRLPKYNAEKITERRHGRRMENYLSPASLSFDPEFREVIYSKFERTVNDKRTHDKELRVIELLTFLEDNNRAPSKMVPEESKLVATLSNYTAPNSDLYNPVVEKQVYKIDRCFRTGVPKKYRRSINEALIETESKLKEEF